MEDCERQVRAAEERARMAPPPLREFLVAFAALQRTWWTHEQQRRSSESHSP